jgi:hypothetical protein
MPQDEPSTLRVEGKDDVHAIGHLLLRHGVDCKHIPVDITSPVDDKDEATGGKSPLLQEMPTQVISGTGRSVGFVLDADTAPKDRWNAVCDRLRGVGMTPPSEIPKGGFVGEVGSV